MNSSSSPLTSPPKSRRVVTNEDLQLYKAITGRVAEIEESTTHTPALAFPQTIGAIAWRVLTPDMAQLSLRLREICEMGIAHGVRRPQMAEWLRHVSDEAFRRIEEAQARLSDSRRNVITRRVEARQVNNGQLTMDS